MSIRFVFLIWAIVILIDDGVNLGSFRFINWRPAKAEKETAHKSGKCLEKFHEICLFTLHQQRVAKKGKYSPIKSCKFSLRRACATKSLTTSKTTLSLGTHNPCQFLECLQVQGFTVGKIREQSYHFGKYSLIFKPHQNRLFSLHFTLLDVFSDLVTSTPFWARLLLSFSVQSEKELEIAR